MSLRIDFTNVQDSPDFEDLPPGKYHCKITGGEVRDNKDGPSEKNPTGQHINFEFTVQDGQYANRKAWRNAPLGGNGVSILKGTLAATGRFTEGQLDGPLDFSIDDVIGADVAVRIGKRKDNSGTEVKGVSHWEGVIKGSAPSSMLP